MMTRLSLSPLRRSIFVASASVALAFAILVPGPGVQAGESQGAAAFPLAGSFTAASTRQGAVRLVEGDFWVEVAKALQDSGCNPLQAIDDAYNEYMDGLDELQDQYQARLDVVGMLGEAPYDPVINPAQFSSNVTNPFLPLVVGRTLVYEKITPEGLEHIEVETLPMTQMINGVDCRVVRDTVTLDGVLVEDTIDWFAQDVAGNVWYFGEISKNYDEDGLLDNLDGSWRWGKEGARPGIVMLANPAMGDVYRNEFLVNEAEDVAEVLATNVSVSIGLGNYSGCLQTLDFTPLDPDPDAEEHKFYAP
ncbi:MAG: hypothetical protein KDB53_17400, partial [Planctomycetes bacterium]|nr:hypothetical protein [Planctomycetota bacterium]